MDQEKIGKFIAEIRKKKEMTQQELGDKIGVSLKTVSKWETGRGMPELSLLKPLSEQLEISINELLSGERINQEKYQDKLEENIISTIVYSDKKIKEKSKWFGIILLLFGFSIILTAIAIFPSESSWSSIYSILGSIITLIGFSKTIQKISYGKRVALNFLFYITLIAFLFVLDFANVALNDQAPRFSLYKATRTNIIIYETPFYNVYRYYPNEQNEKFIIDKHKKIQDINVDTLFE